MGVLQFQRFTYEEVVLQSGNLLANTQLKQFCRLLWQKVR